MGFSLINQPFLGPPMTSWKPPWNHRRSSDPPDPRASELLELFDKVRRHGHHGGELTAPSRLKRGGENQPFHRDGFYGTNKKTYINDVGLENGWSAHVPMDQNIYFPRLDRNGGCKKARQFWYSCFAVSRLSRWMFQNPAWPWVCHSVSENESFE